MSQTSYTRRLKPGETMLIGDDITITCKRESRGSKTWVVVNAPREVTITCPGAARDDEPADWPPEAS